MADDIVCSSKCSGKLMGFADVVTQTFVSPLSTRECVGFGGIKENDMTLSIYEVQLLLACRQAARTQSEFSKQDLDLGENGKDVELRLEALVQRKYLIVRNPREKKSLRLYSLTLRGKLVANRLVNPNEMSQVTATSQD